MNPCPRYEESLILYSFHELGGKKAVVLQEHLSRCKKCRGFLDALNHAFQMIENHCGSSPDLFLDIQW